MMPRRLRARSELQSRQQASEYLNVSYEVEKTEESPGVDKKQRRKEAKKAKEVAEAKAPAKSVGLDLRGAPTKILQKLEATRDHLWPS